MQRRKIEMENQQIVPVVIFCDFILQTNQGSY